MPPRHAAPPRLQSAHRKTLLIVALIVLGAFLGIGGAVSLYAAHQKGDSVALRWPAAGFAAISVDGRTLAGPHADQVRPIGSIAKLVAALVILDRLPLSVGASGPAFLMTPEDAQLQEQEQNAGLMTAPVRVGQQLTERDLLERMLVLSSSNHTLSLVNRVFGSERAYVAAARTWLHAHRLDDIQIADAVGQSRATQAPAIELISLGRLADANPVVRELASHATVHDGVDQLRGTNDLLGLSGIDGLKTGDTDAAGQCLLFTAPLHADDPADRHRIIGVILSEPSSAQRATDVLRLIGSLRKTYH